MEAWGYSDYNSCNRFQNLDGIEAKIVEHLVNSDSKHADLFWKILKYNDLYALSQPSVSKDERMKMINNDNGETTTKRVFFAPFVDDAWEVQCSSVYIFIEDITPIDHTRAVVGVAIETIVHSKISAIAGDGDPESSPRPDTVNPNDSDSQGSIVVPFKSRESVLLKCVLAELNGLYIDGVGYLVLDNFDARGEKVRGKATMPLFNNRSFYGHSVKFLTEISGVSDDSNIGY